MKKLFLIDRHSKGITANILTICFLVLFSSLIWLGTTLISIPTASANITQSQPQLISQANVAEDIDQQVKKSIDKTMGAGTSEKIEGQIEQTTGTVQRKTGEVTGQVEGAIKEAKGKAKKDIGKVKDTSEEIGSELQETSEGILDKVQDFFGN